MPSDEIEYEIAGAELVDLLVLLVSCFSPTYEVAGVDLIHLLYPRIAEPMPIFLELIVVRKAIHELVDASAVSKYR